MNLQITAPMESSEHAAQEVARIVRGCQPVLTDGAARTVAGWWASPGEVGQHLASLSTGAAVRPEHLGLDIGFTFENNPGIHPMDEDALEALLDWAAAKVEVLA